MKIDLDKEKLTEFSVRFMGLLPTIVIIIVASSFAILSFIALYPRSDDEIVEKGLERLNSLDIRFNTSLLDSLSETNKPSELNTTGGRDPFSSF